MPFDLAGRARPVLVAAALALAAGALSAQSPEGTSLVRRAAPTFAQPAAPVGLPATSLAVDTPAAAPAAIEYSDWYGRRLVVHRVASYAILPLFAAQYYTGTRLMDQGGAPDWARTIHGPLAGSVAGVFALNTLTGGWNLWEGRKDPEGRTSRTAHAVLMMVADAGFAATGALACESEDPGCNRSRHRTVALSSMGVAAVSYLVMLPPFRR